MSASPEQPDQLLLTDAFVPRLTAGQYTLTAKQTLVLETEPGGPVELPPDTKTFSVAAPRFSLDPDEIYSIYPPDGSSGAYESTVPHVVFRRKTLPWERKFGEGEPDKPPPPWMALLLFREDELKEYPFKTRSLSDLEGLGFRLDKWEKNPPADPNGAHSNRCKTLDIPWKLFRKVTPYEDELRYLAHTRGVFKDHKEDLPGIGDGWFSVLLGNRLPTAHAKAKVGAQSDAPPKRDVAVLISLEGLSDYIKADAPKRPDEEMVHLVVLATWSFVSTGPDFKDRVKALYCESNGKEKDLWLRAPLPSAEGAVRTAIKFGYAPLPHNLRQGSRTVSWYRGPLIPVPDPARTANEIFVNADAALQYDEKTRLFDVSYAAAWQLGRLLALQAPEFAWALFLMERGYVADKLTEEAEKKFRGLFDQEKPDLNRARRMLRDDLMVAVALECE